MTMIQSAYRGSQSVPKAELRPITERGPTTVDLAYASPFRMLGVSCNVCSQPQISASKFEFVRMYYVVRSFDMYLEGLNFAIQMLSILCHFMNYT